MDERENRYRNLVDRGLITPAKNPGIHLPKPIHVDAPVPFKDVQASLEADREDRV